MAESQEEVEVLVQRVVKDIRNAFKKNPNIDEIGVISCPEARYNRSPIVLVENKLGLESWCVKFLLPYVHNKLLLYRQRKHWLDREALVDVTCTLLLLNPDFTTAWNIRKELMQCGVLHPERDLYLGKLALTKFPKSPETWIHRRWVLQQVLLQLSALGHSRKPQQGEPCQDEADRIQQAADHLSRTLHQEMRVCSDAASRYPSNYNAWSHRIWVLQHMAKGNTKVFHDELSSMRLWVSMHISDHSGFHYRQFLLKELTSELSHVPAASTTSAHHHASQETNSPPSGSNGHSNGEHSATDKAAEPEREGGLSKVLELFHQEIDLCSNLIQSFPGHETLWCHRRHVFYLWYHWRKEQHPNNCHSSSGSESNLHNNSNPSPVSAADQSCGDGVEGINGQRHAREAMELDGGCLPEPSDSKRLKRGILPFSPPALSSEQCFVTGILEGCCSPEQRRFALAYTKWLGTVIVGQP